MLKSLDSIKSSVVPGVFLGSCMKNRIPRAIAELNKQHHIYSTLDLDRFIVDHPRWRCMPKGKTELYLLSRLEALTDLVGEESVAQILTALPTVMLPVEWF